CERCNHTKQNPGWTHTRTAAGGSSANAATGRSGSRGGTDGATGAGSGSASTSGSNGDGVNDRAGTGSGPATAAGVSGSSTAGGDLTVTTPTGHTYRAARSILPTRAPKPPPPLSPDAITSIRNRFGTGNANRRDDPLFKKKAGHQPVRKNADRNNLGQSSVGRNGPYRKDTGQNNDDSPD
ncbi:MAG: hypothetical protein ACTH0C_05900, partial [Actinomycetaceae bacterium]